MMPRSLSPKYVHIDNPHSYHCTIWRYQPSHRQMLVRVYRFEESGDETYFYLHFGGVVYFEGPLQWSGAALTRGSAKECIAILHKIGIKHAEDAVRSDYYCLFKIKLLWSLIKSYIQNFNKVSQSRIRVSQGKSQLVGGVTG